MAFKMPLDPSYGYLYKMMEAMGYGGGYLKHGIKQQHEYKSVVFQPFSGHASVTPPCVYSFHTQRPLHLDFHVVRIQCFADKMMEAMGYGGGYLFWRTACPYAENTKKAMTAAD